MVIFEKQIICHFHNKSFNLFFSMCIPLICKIILGNLRLQFEIFCMYFLSCTIYMVCTVQCIIWKCANLNIKHYCILIGYWKKRHVLDVLWSKYTLHKTKMVFNKKLYDNLKFKNSYMYLSSCWEIMK